MCVCVCVAAEIEHISGLFQEKQAELQTAVLRVEQLSQQLDELRRGKFNGLQGLSGQLTGTAALELRKLYQELQVLMYTHTHTHTRLSPTHTHTLSPPLLYLLIP